MVDNVTVTQEDREAAADLIEAYWGPTDQPMMKLAASYRAGHNFGPIVQAFARHRIDSIARLSPAPEGVDARESFQDRVQPWMMECFGPEISADRVERCDRFIEEALELVQASGYDRDRAHALVEYVYGRDQGEINQEVGGVMVTLAAHCLAFGVDMHEAGETELARIWTKVEQIRAKQAAKPKHSPLPIALSRPPAEQVRMREALAVKDGENVLIVESRPLGCSYTHEYAHCSHVWECHGDGGDLGGNRVEVKCRLCGAPGDYEEDFWRVVWPTT